MIDRAALARLVPHAGAMCLLDEVVRWDDSSVLCLSRSHLDPGNPLRGASGLAAVHAVEYGAQAMAVHGGLLRSGEAPLPGAPGYLASLRDVVLEIARLDEVEATLEVEARRLLAMGGGVLYEFEVSAGGRRIARGRASVAAAEPSA